MATAQLKRFIEITAASSAIRVDRANGIIRSVKIIGLTSRNGRRYLPEALRQAIGLYEAARVFLNHPRRAEQSDDRQFQDWVGVLRGVQFTGDGLVGDLHLRKESTYFPEICESAEAFSGHFGLSHVADGDSHVEGGVEVITRINEVRSVDIVTDPAATRGLYESSSPYADPTHSPVDIIHDFFDVFMIDTLREVTLACHDGRSEPLSELSARLHVLVNEYAWFRQPKGDGSFGDSEAAGRVRALQQLMDRLDGVLLDPTQPGAIAMVERELTTLANILHPAADAAEPAVASVADRELDWADRGDAQPDPGYAARFGESAKRAADSIRETRRRW